MHIIKWPKSHARAAHADIPEGDYSTERPSSTGQEAVKQAAEPNTAEKLDAKGSLGEPSANNDHHPTGQEVIVTKDNTNPKLPAMRSIDDTTRALCAKKKLKEEIGQVNATDRVVNVNWEKTDTLADGVLFEV